MARQKRNSPLPHFVPAFAKSSKWCQDTRVRRGCVFHQSDRTRRRNRVVSLNPPIEFFSRSLSGLGRDASHKHDWANTRHVDLRWARCAGIPLRISFADLALFAWKKERSRHGWKTNQRQRLTRWPGRPVACRLPARRLRRARWWEPRRPAAVKMLSHVFSVSRLHGTARGTGGLLIRRMI